MASQRPKLPLAYAWGCRRRSRSRESQGMPQSENTVDRFVPDTSFGPQDALRLRVGSAPDRETGATYDLIALQPNPKILSGPTANSTVRAFYRHVTDRRCEADFRVQISGSMSPGVRPSR